MRTRVSAFLAAGLMLTAPMQAADDADPIVVIRVLSKQARLLREGALKQIVISLNDDSSIVEDPVQRQMVGKTVTIRDDNGRALVAIDSRAVAGPIGFTIQPGSGDGTCRVTLGSEERIFSLPFSVKTDAGELRCYARERLSLYAVDSALAEYGGEFRKDREAVLALAHVIRARYFYMKQAPAHNDADFCDLAHCQAYRGRIERNIALGDEWTIRHEKLSNNLFFHSRCGGNTFTEGVFGAGPRTASSSSIRDWLYREGIWLCRDAGSRWERTISGTDLCRIALPDRGRESAGLPHFEYDRSMMLVRIRDGGGTVSIPVETFRLKINRVRGWNFIRSNNFVLSEETAGEETQYRFRGEGLGHGVGLCQHGAVALARRGYNRYEILEHYFPNLPFQAPSNAQSPPPCMSYCIFDLASGKPLKMSHGRDFLQRKAPPGSIFKLIVALYLAAERPDLFNNYAFTCPGKGPGDRHMPDRCWDPKGHGMIKIEKAIAHSCNLYFASLYNKISEKKFRIFYERLCRSLAIPEKLPDIKDERGWSQLLAGLDFRVSFAVGDYIRLAMFMNCGPHSESTMRYSFTEIPLAERNKLFRSLQGTFISGTVSGGPEKATAHADNDILKIWEEHSPAVSRHELWGKTATIADGTNKALGHGLFIGGSGTTGIVAIARRSSGRTTARWARMILSRFIDGE